MPSEKNLNNISFGSLEEITEDSIHRLNSFNPARVILKTFFFFPELSVFSNSRIRPSSTSLVRLG